MKPINIRVPASHLALLKKEGYNVSEICRDAIKKIYEKTKKKPTKKD